MDIENSYDPSIYQAEREVMIERAGFIEDVMNIVIGADHAGFKLKETLKKALASSTTTLTDIGCFSEEPVDYPDIALALSTTFKEGDFDKGILICGSGVGATIAANKIQGIRASVCHDTYSAHQGVEHDDMNILVLGARIIGETLALEIVESFLKARFSNEERHTRRVNKINALDKDRPND